MARSQEFIEAVGLVVPTSDGWVLITSHKRRIRADRRLRALWRPTREYQNVLKDALEKSRLDGYRESEGSSKRR